MVHVFFFFLLFFRVIFKEEEIMTTNDPFTMQLSHYNFAYKKQKKRSNIYVFIHSPFFPDGKLKIFENQKKEITIDQDRENNPYKANPKKQYLRLEKFRSFILTFSQNTQNIVKNANENEMKLNISIDSDDDLPFKITYWRIPEFFCKTSTNFFISTDYQIKSNVELMEDACMFFDPKGVSNLFKMNIFSSEQITIEFYINNSLYTNPDYECSSSQPNQTLSCVVPYSQPFFARIAFNKKKFINNLNCLDTNNCNLKLKRNSNYNNNNSRHNKLKANFSLDYSSLYKSQEVHDCFIERIPFIQIPNFESQSSFLSEDLKQISHPNSDNKIDRKNAQFKIENKVCIKFSGYKSTVISRLATFFSLLFIITFVLQLIGYIDFCGWSRKPAEVAFIGLRDKVGNTETIMPKKSKNKKHASSMDELHNTNNEDIATSPLVFSIGPDLYLQQSSSKQGHKKTVSCANFRTMSQSGQSRDLRKLSESGGRTNNRSGSGNKRTNHREVVFQLPNFIASSPSSSSSSSLQEYKFETVVDTA